MREGGGREGEGKGKGERGRGGGGKGRGGGREKERYTVLFLLLNSLRYGDSKSTEYARTTT